jgi:uncharacterized protein (TIGR03437 family)
VDFNIAPGELASVYGNLLGQASPFETQLDSTGKVATSLGGYSVLVNGIAAPLLYVGANQINFVVPFEIANAISVTVQVMTPAGPSAPVTGLAAVATRAELNPILVNQDGTINSPSHPAPRLSTVTFWASGGGAMNVMVDGAVNAAPLPQLKASVGIRLGVLSPADLGVVTYAGAAPGMVAGVLQINFQIPASHAGYGSCHVACPVILGIGGSSVPPPYAMVYLPN